MQRANEEECGLLWLMRQERRVHESRYNDRGRQVPQSQLSINQQVSGGKMPQKLHPKTTYYFVQNWLPFIPFASSSQVASLS